MNRWRPELPDLTFKRERIRQALIEGGVALVAMVPVWLLFYVILEGLL
jgi:hypothetical protein